LGSLYNGLSKIELADGVIENMDKFLESDPEAFKEYAIQDSLITLVHGMCMESFNHGIKCLGVPITLSAMSSNFVKLT